MRDHLDIRGHDQAAKATEQAVRNNDHLTEVFIHNIHSLQPGALPFCR